MAKKFQVASNFYSAELSKLPVDRGLTYDSKGAWIRCPIHSGGMERTPSMKINVDPGPYQGSYYCFGACRNTPDGKGSWNKLTKFLPMLKKVSDGAKATSVGFSFKKFDDEVEIPDFSKLIPWTPTKDWRDIRGETLVAFDTRVVQLGNKYINLMFPVTTYDEPVGYIRAIFNKPRIINGKKERTYFNMDGTWAKNNLFGYDQARKLRKQRKKLPLWIVEGPRDTMNVYQHGGWVVGLIGSYVGPRKLALIKELDPSVIIIATDNDDSGNSAAEALRENLASIIPCIRLKFKNGRDPANLTYLKVQRFNRMAMKRAA